MNIFGNLKKKKNILKNKNEKIKQVISKFFLKKKKKKKAFSSILYIFFILKKKKKKCQKCIWTKVTAEFQITMLPTLVVGQDQSSSWMMQKPLHIEVLQVHIPLKDHNFEILVP